MSAAPFGGLHHVPAVMYNPDGTLQGVGVSNPSGSFTRPLNQTPYASGQAVLNSTILASVVIPSIVLPRNNFLCQRVRLQSTSPSLLNAVYRVHLFRSLPVLSVADGAAIAITTGRDGWLDSTDVTMKQSFADGSSGVALFEAGGLAAVLPAQPSTLWWLLEFRGTANRTPASGEVFTLVPELLQ